jgi:hypothetical protein
MVGQKNNQKIVGTRFSVLNYTPPGTYGGQFRRHPEAVRERSRQVQAAAMAPAAPTCP